MSIRGTEKADLGPLVVEARTGFVRQRFRVSHGPGSNMVDALFGSSRDEWVEMYAGPKGMELIQGLLPNLIIKWASHDWQGKAPADWQAFEIHVPSAVAVTDPKPSFLDVIPEGQSVGDSTRDQLCLLIAFGVKRAGGRAAVFREDGRREIFRPQLAG
jgi:hypothetical protein